MSKIKTKILDNGLTLVGEPVDSSLSSSIGFFVKTGARDEKKYESGVSHFLEHMMFKGTKTRSALDITYELGNLGAQANAYTSEESTVFYATVVPEKFTPMLVLLSDMLRPALREDDFQTEKQVILEEIALYQDRPQFLLFEKSLQAFFNNHPAGNSVLGTNESITNLTANQMADYFERRYSPANMALVATGNFDWNNFYEYALKLTKDWKAFETGRDAKDFFKAQPETIKFKKSGINQTHLLLINNGVSAQDEDRYSAEVLATLIGDSSGSKLYWELVETGLCETCVLDFDQKDNTGVVLVYASTTPQNLDSVKSKIFNILDNSTEFTDQDLQRAKRKIATKVVLSGELSIGRLMTIGNDWLYRKKISDLTAIQDKILSVSKEEVFKVIEKIKFNSSKDWSCYYLVNE